MFIAQRPVWPNKQLKQITSNWTWAVRKWLFHWGQKSVVHDSMTGVATTCRRKKGILLQAPLSLLQCRPLVILCWVLMQWLVLTSSLSCVSILAGHVEYEQTVETTTDSKNHDGVWETGLDNIFLELTIGQKYYMEMLTVKLFSQSVAERSAITIANPIDTYLNFL